MSATRVPFLQPMPCSQAPNAAESVSSSAKVSDLPMHENAGRAPYLRDRFLEEIAHRARTR